MSQTVYKIVDREAWKLALTAGEYTGSAVDIEDGFIHLSAADQVAETLAKHFQKRENLLIVAVSVDALAAELKWEPSRGGQLFPHLYGPLRMPAVVWTHPLELENGTHRLPGALSSGD